MVEQNLALSSREAFSDSWASSLTVWACFPLLLALVTVSILVWEINMCSFKIKVGSLSFLTISCSPKSVGANAFLFHFISG
jgi:hypothetical protein